jgi:D-3-phosphoglycerate dehydrogenase / 2-oxoglutarate reductase
VEGSPNVRVAILDDYTSSVPTLTCFPRLHDHDVSVYSDHTDNVDELAHRLADVEILVLIRERTRITSELLTRLPRLQLVSLRSAYSHVDVDACTQHGVLVCSNLHQGTPSSATAELTWALILAGVRRIPQQMASLRAGRWQESIGETLRGRTLGVYGYGRIGEVVAGYGRAFAMNVLVWASESSRARAESDGWTVASDRETFFATSDVVTVHQRLVPATRHTVTAVDFREMSPHSLFVNTSRAGLVVPGALVAALDAGRPGAAAVDVFEDEPIRDVTHPLLTRDNVVCTPHIGFVTRDEWELQFSDIFDQVVAFAAGAPINVVNPEARRS